MKARVRTVRVALIGAIAASLLTASTVPAHALNARAAAQSVSVAPSGVLLRLPDTVFRPGTMNRNGLLANTNLYVTDAGHWPRRLHTTGYASWGRITGYLQGAIWQPPRATDRLTWIYAGHVFSSADGAQRAWHDGAITALVRHNNYSSSSCAGTVGLNCTRLNDAGTEFNDFVRFGVCLSETTVFELGPNLVPGTSQHLLQTQRTQALYTLAHIDIAAISAMRNTCAIAEPTATPTPVPTSTPRPTPVPTPKPKKPTFSFTGLATLSASRHPQTTFRQGEQGYLKISWTAKHLKGRNHADISIRFQAMNHGAWHTLSSPPLITLPTTNGANSYQTGFYTPRGYSAMRMTAALHLLGRWSHSKSVTISIRK